MEGLDEGGVNEALDGHRDGSSGRGVVVHPNAGWGIQTLCCAKIIKSCGSILSYEILSSSSRKPHSRRRRCDDDLYDRVECQTHAWPSPAG